MSFRHDFGDGDGYRIGDDEEDDTRAFLAAEQYRRMSMTDVDERPDWMGNKPKRKNKRGKLEKRDDSQGTLSDIPEWKRKALESNEDYPRHGPCSYGYNTHKPVKQEKEGELVFC